MKKGLIKALSLAVVFLAALAVFGGTMNQSQVDYTTEMEQAKLPVIVLYENNEQINELHGYRTPMKATGMRDTITPLSSNKEIPLMVRAYGCKIDDIAYEIRSIDGERLVSDGSIAPFEERDGQIRTSVPVQSLLEQPKEYILTLLLKQKDETYYYYTRIADGQDCYVAQSVQFAKKINELTFAKDTDALSDYWEPNETGDNSTLHKVNIHSSANQATWAGFACSRLSAPIPSVKEMNSSYNVVVLDYPVTASGKNGEIEYYNVQEYYRIRYTDERMYLLDFERTMNQIFQGENDFLYDNYLQLGIRSTDVEYKLNETQKVACFVQEGDLYSYNQATNRLVEVFSFRGHEGIEARENYMQHDIRILDVDEAGSIDYIVYGYMNRGAHEGQVGASFLHYDSLTNTNAEKAFLAFDKSFEILKAEFGKLLYESVNGGMYLFYNGSACHIDLETAKVEEVANRLQDGQYAVSDSMRYFAWVSDQKAKEITVMDFEDGSAEKIHAGKGKTLHVLGFLQEDLVYGISAEKNRAFSGAASSKKPMHALRIVNASNMEVLKEYRKKGYYIDRVEFSSGVLTIHRLAASGDGYTKASSDSIVNRNREEESDCVHTTVTEKKQTQVQLALSQPEADAAPALVAAKLMINPDQKEIEIKTQEEHEAYFAYAAGKIIAVTTDAGSAVRAADERMGIVIDEKQNYIWRRSRPAVKLLESLTPSVADGAGSSGAKCISAMLKSQNLEVNVTELLAKGETPQEILESLLPGKSAIGVEDGTLSQMLYYVGLGNPVLAVKSDGQAVLLAGYDALNVWLYEPQTGMMEKKTIEDAVEMFEQAGGSFLAFY